MKLVKVVDVTKKDVVKMLMSDALVLSEYLNSIVNYGQILLEELELQESGYCGDGGNDPENLCSCNRHHTKKRLSNSDKYLNTIIISAEDKLSNISLLETEELLDQVKTLLASDGMVVTSESVPPQLKQNSVTECFVVEEGDFLMIDGVISKF